MHRPTPIRLAHVAPLFLLTVCWGQDPEDGVKSARAHLTRGVHEIAAPGVPGPLVVLGDRAAAVVAGMAGAGAAAPVVAAAEHGRGRIVAFGHTGYLTRDVLTKADTAKLVENAIAWAARKGGSQGPRIGCQDAGFADALKERGFRAEAAFRGNWTPALREFDVLCFSHRDWTEAEANAVKGFVEGGGGALIAGLGWGWLQLNPGKRLDEHPGNHLTAAAGILWADGTLERTGKEGFVVKDDGLDLCNADRALGALAKDTTEKDLTQIATTLRAALASIPRGDHPLRAAARRYAGASGAQALPAESRPLSRADGRARLILTLQLDELGRAEGTAARAHPAAREFPGLPAPGAKPVARTVEVDCKVPAWHGTGLYAAAGEPFTITLTGEAASAGLGVRIGCHTDELWHLDRWRRVPEVSRYEKLTTASTVVSSPFGGLIYVDVPPNCRAGVVAAEISGAYLAPRFVLGETGAEAWRESIRQYPAPWAELETKSVVLTFPSRFARTLDEPDKLLTFWDAVAGAAADFVAIPRERARPERFVADVQISAGYMHSGYPIMLPFAEVDNLIGLDRLRKGTWGLYHELGHNHQDGAWTFEGTGEVTNNVIAMYILDTLCGVPPGQGWGGFDGVKEKVAAYVVKGAPFETWKSDPALALWMYKQLHEAFGWEPFKRVFAEYRKLTAGERPRTDAGKRDQWMVRFSRAVNRNLGPFFEAWGVPTSTSARESIANLPAWMPADFPPRNK